jgi:hypothetical protein
MSQAISNRPCVRALTATAWVQTRGRSPEAVIQLECSNASVKAIDGREVYGELLSEDVLRGSHPWTPIKISARIPPLCETVRVFVRTRNSDGDVDVDDVSASLEATR